MNSTIFAILKLARFVIILRY